MQDSKTITNMKACAFSLQSYDRLRMAIYQGKKWERNAYRSTIDPEFNRMLDAIEELIQVGKQYYVLGERRRSYRVFLRCCIIVNHLKIVEFPK